MVKLDDNFETIALVYASIKKQIAEEFKNTFHPDHISFPVTIDNVADDTIVCFNIANYQSKTYAELTKDISAHVSYIHDVDLHESNMYGELVLIIEKMSLLWQSN